MLVAGLIGVMNFSNVNREIVILVCGTDWFD